MTFYDRFDSPIGCLLIASDGAALTHVWRLRPGQLDETSSGWREDPSAAPLPEARRQLEAYFRGELREFDLPLRPAGTDFQKRVWNELVKIPYAETISYGELAKRVGNPNASRAVGMANGKNPLMIVVPCHRVIGASGKLTGFSAGIDAKDVLLDLERSSAGSGRAVR